MALKKKLCSSAAPRWMTYAAFGLVALLALTLVYQYSIKVSGKPWPWAERFESGSQGRLVFLYMTGCGWCDRFKPEWTILVNKFGAEISARRIAIESYERTDKGAAEFEATVSSYPTILFIADGKTTVYKGERTAVAIRAFVMGSREGYENQFNAVGKSINTAQGNKPKPKTEEKGPSSVPGSTTDNVRDQVKYAGARLG